MEPRHGYLLLVCLCLFMGSSAWFAWLSVVAAELGVPLEAAVRQMLAASDQTLGHLEVEVPRQIQQRQRRAAEAAAQAEADASRLAARSATTLLSRLAHGHQRTFRTRFGPCELAAHLGLMWAVQEVTLCGRCGAATWGTTPVLRLQCRNWRRRRPARCTVKPGVQESGPRVWENVLRHKRPRPPQPN